MKLTLENFFSRLIFHPFEADTKKDRVIALIASIACGVFSIGICHIVCAIRNWCFTHIPSDKVTAQDSSKKELQEGVSISKEATAEDVSEKELQEGVSISEETVSKIQTCMKNILQSKEEDGVKIYKSQGNHRVFALDTAPGLIFKLKADKNVHTPDKDDSMKARYQKMINAQTVLRTHQLGLLVLPHAKLFNVHAEDEEYEIIAEQKVDIHPNDSVQEQFFEDYADSLNETIRQLAIFICKTGYSDVEWRNNPVLQNSLDKNGNRKIALIDIEEMDNNETGLFGGAWRRGLVGLVNEEQGKIVESVAKQNGVSTSKFADALDERKQELDSNRKLKEYYGAKNITQGDELIQVDIDSLGLDLNKEGQIIKYDKLIDDDIEETIKLRRVVEDVLNEMNKCIQAKDPQSTAKGKRYFLLNINKKPMSQYNGLGLPEGTGPITKEEEKQRWPFVIIQSLIEKGHIFKLDKVNGHGYFIQA